MKIGEYLNKKKRLFIITIILIVALIIMSIIVFGKKNNQSDNIQEQDLSITYNITKEQMAPMDKTNGSINAPLSTIVIKNNKSYQQKYKLIIKSDDKSTLELNKIYILIDNEVRLLSDYKDGVVYTNTIDGNKESIISLKTWIASDLIESSDSDKVVNLKYEVIKE